MTVLQFLEAFLRVHRKLAKHLSRLCRQEGLSGLEFFVLWKVNKKGLWRVTELAAASDIPASTLTGILDRLERQGWIKRTPDPGDRRSVLVEGTPELKEFLAGFFARVEEELSSLFSTLPFPSLLGRLTSDLQLLGEHLNAEKEEEES